MRIRFKLSDADREKWGGDEWLMLDTDKVGADLGYDRIAELEREIRKDDNTTSIGKILAIELVNFTALGMRGGLWLARQVNGLDKPAWSDFKPNPLGARFVIDTGDDDPPAGGSSEPPSEPKPKARARSAQSKKA
jgi:hypothetical protein